MILDPSELGRAVVSGLMNGLVAPRPIAGDVLGLVGRLGRDDWVRTRVVFELRRPS